MPQDIPEANGTHVRFELDKFEGDFYAIARAHDRPVRLTFPYAALTGDTGRTYVQVRRGARTRGETGGAESARARSQRAPRVLPPPGRSAQVCNVEAGSTVYLGARGGEHCASFSATPTLWVGANCSEEDTAQVRGGWLCD